MWPIHISPYHSMELSTVEYSLLDISSPLIFVISFVISSFFICFYVIFWSDRRRLCLQPLVPQPTCELSFVVFNQTYCFSFHTWPSAPDLYQMYPTQTSLHIDDNRSALNASSSVNLLLFLPQWPSTQLLSWKCGHPLGLIPPSSTHLISYLGF